ncbi:MAG: lipopolysaccharide assembly protein LapB [Gammaproteobacteria bacterium]|nr:lipopolysaccharide assembly protein LapB [Gammaproteobacteria bacterium]
MELLFLLLPIAALSGWLLARKQYNKTNLSHSSALNPDYFKGLNFLLNEQPDKAIDIFIKLLEVNSETVETHLALANLFRRRGETDRAIRIHQNLIARPTLTPVQRDTTLIELGLDYMNAGVLDRAEHLFLEILNKTSPPTEAYQQLLRLYQQEKKWPQAIDMAIKFQSHAKEDIGPTIAQFYCELAEQQMLSESNSTLPILKKAHYYDANCVRASLLKADCLIRAEKVDKAIKVLQNIEKQNVNYISEALQRLLSCYQNTHNLSGFHEWLHALLSRHPTITSARIMLAQVIQMQHGSQAAHDYLYQQLQSHPSVEGLHTLMSLDKPSDQTLVPLIKGITHTMVRRGHRYSCQNCGFSGKTMHWQCPSCKRWNSVKPTEIHLSSLESLLELSQ